MKQNLFKEIPLKVLLALKDKLNKGKNKSQIARKINCTQSYYSKIIDKFEKIGLLISRKGGRGTKTDLTKKGENVVDKFLLINKQLPHKSVS